MNLTSGGVVAAGFCRGREARRGIVAVRRGCDVAAAEEILGTPPELLTGAGPCHPLRILSRLIGKQPIVFLQFRESSQSFSLGVFRLHQVLASTSLRQIHERISAMKELWQGLLRRSQCFDMR